MQTMFSVLPATFFDKRSASVEFYSDQVSASLVSASSET
jgi:hypothetical protein